MKNELVNSARAKPTRYATELGERRETAHLEQLANFGQAMGWSLFLAGGFFWFCVVSSVDWFWLCLMLAGLVLLALSIVVPESLARPCHWWMTLARWQGWLVMTVLLTIVYFTLVTPVGWLIRTRNGTNPFLAWDTEPPDSKVTPGWEPITTEAILHSKHNSTRRRSLPRLLLNSLNFFIERGHFLLLPILIALLTLGLLLFFVQGSVLAPFIYTIF